MKPWLLWFTPAFLFITLFYAAGVVRAETPAMITNQATYSYRTSPNGDRIAGSSIRKDLVDPSGQVLGCSGEVLPDYHGFTVGIYEPNPQDPTLKLVGPPVALTPTAFPVPAGSSVSPGVAPNLQNINPFPLSTATAGTYSFLLDPNRGQLDAGKTYILVINPPQNSSYNQRRVRIVIGARNGQVVSYTASSLDGGPISAADGRTSVTGLLFIVGNGPASTSLAFLKLDSSICGAHQVQILKTGDRASAQPGDTVVYRVSVRNMADTPLSSIKVNDILPLGFRFMPQSVQAAVAGKPVTLSTTANGSTIVFNAGALSLAANGTLTIAYAATLTPEAVRSKGQNSASVTANLGTGTVVPVSDGPAIYTVQVRQGMLSDTGTVIGRVFIDKNFDGEQQDGEAGVPNAVILLDNAIRVTTDPTGLYSVPNVTPGYHTAVLDLSSIPGYALAPNLHFIERNSHGRMVHLEPGGLVRANFGVTPGPDMPKTSGQVIGIHRVAPVSAGTDAAGSIADIGTTGSPITAPPAGTPNAAPTPAPLTGAADTSSSNPGAHPAISAPPVEDPITVDPVTGEKEQPVEDDSADAPAPPAETTPISPDANSGAPGTTSIGIGSSAPAATISASATAGLAPRAVRILTPEPDAVYDVPAIAIVIQFAVGSQVTLKVNGREVDSTLVGRTETNAATNLVTQTFYGVGLDSKDNTITAQAMVNGLPGPVTSLKVQVRGAAQTIQIHAIEKSIPADGRSTAAIEGELLDEHGNLSHRDTTITLSATAGQFLGATYNPDLDGFQVQTHGGKFRVALQSGLTAQIVRIRASVGGIQTFTQLQFDTALGPPIVSGVVDLRVGRRGTDFYGSMEDFLRPFSNNNYGLQAYGSAFASIPIGRWSFTGAYNSDHTINQTSNGQSGLERDNSGLDQQYQYSVLGDSSTGTPLADSEDNLYLRLEHNQNYLMWGNYGTDEFSTKSQELTAISRRFHAFKANYSFGNVQVTGLYGNNVRGFQRDSIVPDGTSGYYFLSRRPLVIGSELIAVELQDFNRPGTALSRTLLSRDIDYVIDYDRGTILFKRPMLQTDLDANGNQLTRVIVATYEFDQPGQNSSVYGGRVRYHLSNAVDRESWLGATYFRENQGVRNFQLEGVDALFPFGGRGTIVAEVGHSSNTSELLGQVDGTAYRVEADGTTKGGVHGHAYVKSASTGYSNDATISFVPGQTRYGAEVTAPVTTKTDLHVQVDREHDAGVVPQPSVLTGDLLNPSSSLTPVLPVNNSLTSVIGGIKQRLGSATLNVDYIHRDRTDDTTPGTGNTSSSQVQTHLMVPLRKNLAFDVLNSAGVTSGQDPVYPNQTSLNLNWAVQPNVDLRLSQQFFSGTQLGGHSITSLETVSQQAIGKNTNVAGRFGIISGANGLSTEEAVGLDQHWTLSPGLRINLAYEKIMGSFFRQTGSGQQFAQPYAPGQSSGSLGFGRSETRGVGVEYTANPNLKASARYETRISPEGSNTVISAAAAGKISRPLTALMSFQSADTANQTIHGLGNTTDLKVGMAYRDPNNDKWNALVRYEYRKNPSTIPDTLLLGSGTGSTDNTLAIEGVYAPSWKWELYNKYAVRTGATYLSHGLVGSTMISLAQWRATYRLGYRTDLVGELRSLWQPGAMYSTLGAVIEGGYYITPDLRLAEGYSFGKVSDLDFGGTRTNGGFYMGLTAKLTDLFDGFSQPHSLTLAQLQAARAVRVVQTAAVIQRGLAPGEISPLDHSSTAYSALTQAALPAQPVIAAQPHPVAQAAPVRVASLVPTTKLVAPLARAVQATRLVAPVRRLAQARFVAPVRRTVQPRFVAPARSTVQYRLPMLRRMVSAASGRRPAQPQIRRTAPAHKVK